MGLFRGNFKSKTARYPESIYLDLPERLQNKRNVIGSQLGNTATQSSVTGGVKGYGVNLAEWITWAINEGKISITGVDTHSFNTNLTTAASRSHTVSSTASYAISTLTFGVGININNATPSLALGVITDTQRGRILFDATDIDISNSDGGVIKVGDTETENNGHVFIVDDSAVAPYSFSGTNLVAKTTTYADDTAAGVGAIPVGGHYFNSTTGAIHTRMS